VNPEGARGPPRPPGGDLESSIRHEQGVAAGLASISGISLEPPSATQGLGRKIIALRTQLTVDATRAYRAQQGL